MARLGLSSVLLVVSGCGCPCPPATPLPSSQGAASECSAASSSDNASSSEESRAPSTSGERAGDALPPLGTVTNEPWTRLENYQYGDDSPCEGEGNVVFLDGDVDEFVHPGQDRITAARFSQKNAKFPHTVSLRVEPAGEEHGNYWSFTFSSKKLERPVETREYVNAERAAFASYQRPGLDISGDHRGCNKLGGRFKISEVEWDGDRLKKFKAVFVQHCEGKEPQLRGCISYEDKI